MGLFDSLNAFAGKVEAFAGIVHPSAPLKPATASAFSAPSDVSDLQGKLSKITGWRNALASRNRLEVSRTPGSKMAQAIAIWDRDKAAQAVSDISYALETVKSVAALVASGQTPDSADLSDAADAKKDAAASYSDAISYAQRINDHIDSDTANAARGITPEDFTPAAIVRPAASAVGGAYASAKADVSGAVSSIERAASAAASTTTDWLKYLGYGAVGLAALYALALAKTTLPNPSRIFYRRGRR